MLVNQSATNSEDRTGVFDKLNEAWAVAKSAGYFLGAKLVRGAYMEKERDRAESLGYQSPIQLTKEQSDRAFNDALEFSVENINQIALICGSHNKYINLYLIDLMRMHGICKDDNRIWFAQLYGMSDNISFNLAKAGCNVVKYLPYGPVRSVIPYLLRRAAESTSVAGESSRELLLIHKELNRRRKAVTTR